MSWARYDDELTLNYKYGRLRAMGVNGMAALGLHLAANTYARHNGTGGVIEPHVPELLAGKAGPKLAAILVEVGMFDEVLGGGAWIVHDFADYHDPNDPHPDKSAADRKIELRDKRAAAGRLGGLAKAGKRSSKTGITGGKRSSKPKATRVKVPGQASKPSKRLALLQQTPSPVPVPSTTSSTQDRYVGETAA